MPKQFVKVFEGNVTFSKKRFLETKVLLSHRIYTLLDEVSGYKIKSILFAPGKRLNLQNHFHRHERWVVVSRTSKIPNGDKDIVIRANELTYIKVGEVHQLENPWLIDLVVIKVQVGEYAGENDIVRIKMILIEKIAKCISCKNVLTSCVGRII